MYPPSTALPDELSKAYLALLLHLHDEAEQLAMVGTVACDDIRSTAEDMVTILHATDKRVELLAAVARGHHDGLSPRFADGVEELVY